MSKSAAAQKKSAESDVAETNSVQTETTKLEAVKEDSQESKKKSHYPEGTRLFTYTPNGGGEVIELPLDFEYPDKKWLWRNSKLPFLGQTFEWLNRAKVPNAMQERVVELPDDEYPDMFSQWFQAIGGATVGE